RPHVSRHGWFNFDRIPQLIEAGAAAAEEVLASIPLALEARRGIHPRQSVSVRVLREHCTACGMCIAQAPHAMMRGADGKAMPIRDEFDWSPVDSDFSVHCPTRAIVIERHGTPDTVATASAAIAVDG
ncbi:MAG TPA: ferredoxin, partial [Gemmatimonadaceae bacterium]|nr:ferredoxin [Gemmatimonadaceae bacterium]